MVLGEGRGAGQWVKQREQEREEEEWRKATGGVSTQIISPSLTSLVATPNLPLPASYFTSTALEKAGKCLLGDFSFGNSFSRKLRDVVVVLQCLELGLETLHTLL